MKVSYIRVSTVEQNTARQEEAMQNLGIEKTFIERISWKNIVRQDGLMQSLGIEKTFIEEISWRNTERPELLNMLNFIREGDVVYIESFSRLAINIKDLINIVETIQSKGASVVSLKEGFDLTTPAGKMMLTMMGSLYQFELECLKEIQKEEFKPRRSNLFERW